MEAISLNPGRRRATLIAILVILAGGIAAFANSFKGQFVFDDLLSLRQNETTERLWRLDRVLNPPVNMTVGGRPLLNFSFAIDRSIFGLNPAGYHIGNLLIHLCAALTLFGLIRRLLIRFPSVVPIPWAAPSDPTWLAAAIALLWVVHPLQTESVTYLVQRAECLMGLWYLLTLYLFVRGIDEPRFLSLSILCCWLGMATKEAMVSAPLLVLLCDRTFVSTSFAAAWRLRRSYYLALFSSWQLLAVLIGATHGRGGTVGLGYGVGLIQYWLTQFPAVVRYLWLSLWPHPLVFDYGTEWVTNSAELVPCVVVVVVLLALTIQGLRRGTASGLLGGWFFAILAPTSLVPGVRQASAEHRLYLPLAAVIVAVVIGAYRAWGRRTLLVWPLFAALLTKLTLDRNWFYAHPVALWQDTVSRRPDNPYSRNNYGGALLEAHLPANALIQLKESVRLKPDFLEGHGNLGSAYLNTGDLPRALNEYRIAAELGPQFAAVHNNYGVALLAAQQPALAQQEFETAIRIDPRFGEAFNNLGNARLRQGDPAGAVANYRRALELSPHLPKARENLQHAIELSAKPPPSAAR